MLQHNGHKLTPNLETRRDEIPSEGRDAVLEAKDRIIAELREEVVFLHGELRRKDAILSRVAEEIGEAPRSASKATDGSQTVVPERVKNGNNQARDARNEQEKPGRPTLPDGYRVVAISSDAWVLVAPRGLRVAGYRGELDLGKVALDANEHHQRK
ncbi:MAG: hypothetical protein JOZ19_09810 [Rubrobacter sp.]|nr:hypothetical protein [Rubrobacter sp.]